MHVLRIRSKRLIKIEEQFPDAIDTLARAMRAGHPLAAGMQMLVMEAPEPLAGEIRVTVEERKLGLSWDQALDNFMDRLPLVEVSTFVAAVKLQNRTGGKLSEVLGRLADTMREAEALKGEVRAIAAHGKMAGLVLTILPVGIAAVMAIVNPSYLLVLWTNPTGQAMVAGAAVCLIMAHFVIRKMVDIRI
jgi:tight adherence protein B